MSTLRITLDSLRDLGSPTGPGTPGTAQTATIYCQPSLSEGGVLADGLHSIPDEIVNVEILPWSHDLVDPTDAQPTAWGWTVTIRPEAGRALVAPLTAETIAALPQVDGVRVARLEDHVGLSDALATGGTVVPVQGASVVGATDNGDGTVTFLLSDGSSTDPVTIPPGPAGLSAFEVAVSLGYVGTEAQWVATLKGDPGDPGDPGSDSTVPGPPGPSAYEVAVSLGFTGTEAQWVATLKGDPGDPGDPGSDSTVPGPAGRGITSIEDPDLDGVATVTYTDETTSPLPLPRGDVGPANSLAVGTVSTLAAGASATASVTGTAPAQTLNLGIPQGAAGPAGSPTAFELRGTGMPNGVIAASPGTYYTDTAGTNGAWRWLKTSGTGNTGWTVIHGDTGWRIVTGEEALTQGALNLRRINDTVFFVIGSGAFRLSKISSNNLIIGRIPHGFRTQATEFATLRLDGGKAVCGILEIQDGGGQPGPVLARQLTAATATIQCETALWAARDPWPTTLPGTPA